MTSPTRAKGTKIALIVAVATALVVVGVALTLVGGPSDHGAGLLAAKLDRRSYAFNDLQGVSDAQCSYIGRHGTRAYPLFSCAWSNEAGEHAAKFELLGKTPARVTEGGEAASPPGSAAQATAVTTAADQREHGPEGSYECTQAPTAEVEHAFSCLLLRNGNRVVVKGNTARVKWVWNDDGTVSSELLEFSSPYDEATRFEHEASQKSREQEATTSTDASPSTPSRSTVKVAACPSNGLRISGEFLPSGQGRIEAITALGVGCEEAIRVVRRWIELKPRGEANNVSGYECAEKRAPSYGVSVMCSSESRRVEFRVEEPPYRRSATEPTSGEGRTTPSQQESSSHSPDHQCPVPIGGHFTSLSVRGTGCVEAAKIIRDLAAGKGSRTYPVHVDGWQCYSGTGLTSCSRGAQTLGAQYRVP